MSHQPGFANVHYVAGRINRIVSTLIVEGLKSAAPDLELDTDDLKAVLSAGEEGAPLEPYRRILRAAIKYDGGMSLLGAGRSVKELRHPLLYVLLNSDSPELLLEKEARLGEFFHSRHQVIIESQAKFELSLLHSSKLDEPPEPAESLANCGIHLTLLEEIGCTGLKLRFPTSPDPDALVYSGGVLRLPPLDRTASAWHFTWSAFTPRPPLEGLDDVLLGSGSPRILSEKAGPEAEVERIVRQDLARTWRVSDVARALGMSPRSLQRALGVCGERYSDLVDRIRNDEAERLLRESQLSITEVGYVCGFADGSHFTRSFKKRFGMRPSEARAASK